MEKAQTRVGNAKESEYRYDPASCVGGVPGNVVIALSIASFSCACSSLRLAALTKRSLLRGDQLPDTAFGKVEHRVHLEPGKRLALGGALHFY